jgi:hypothetical protein
MRYRIVEAATLKDTGALYLIVHFWKDKVGGPPLLINDFIMQFLPDEPIEDQIKANVERYAAEATVNGYEGDHSLRAALDFKANGKVLRAAGTATPSISLSKRDPHGYVAKAGKLK